MIKICGVHYTKDELHLLKQNPNPVIAHDLADFLEEWFSDKNTLAVQTSGSTGIPKSFEVEKERMIASAKMTCSFLGLETNDKALLCMPLKYIGAKMMVVRSLVFGLDLYCVQASSHPLKETAQDFAFIAMTPAQVHSSVSTAQELEKLKQTKHLIIGGGAINEQLADILKDFPNHVWSTYGMTETLSHIALRKINGTDNSEWYQPFNGIKIGLSEQNTLTIYAPQICERKLVTNDLAQINASGQFRISGRIDNTVNSGGIKIQIEELEKLLAPHMDFPFLISSVPDNHYGEIVVILIAHAPENDEISQLKKQYFTHFKSVLPLYHCPKHIVFIEKLPSTGTDKPDRAKAKEIARQKIQS